MIGKSTASTTARIFCGSCLGIYDAIIRIKMSLPDALSFSRAKRRVADISPHAQHY
jgi:hypothetical protein